MNIMVIVSLLLLESPWIVFQKMLDSLFQSVIWKDFSSDFFTCYWLDWAFRLVVIFQKFSLIAKSFLWENRILHKH